MTEEESKLEGLLVDSVTNKTLLADVLEGIIKISSYTGCLIIDDSIEVYSLPVQVRLVLAGRWASFLLDKSHDYAFTSDRIANLLNVRVKSVENILEMLREDGVVVENESGFYLRGSSIKDLNDVRELKDL